MERPHGAPPRALVLMNSQARSVEARGDAARAALEAHGFSLNTPELKDRESVVRTIREQASSCDLIVVGGGDGSLHVALQGLVGVAVPLGIIPLGTANDLASSLGIPSGIEAACEVIARGYTREIDVGHVNDVFFFNEMGIGISPTVSRLLEKDAKAKFGVIAALPHAIGVMRKMRRFTVKITHGEEVTSLKTAQLTIGNGRSYGGFIKNEDASLVDHKLDLYALSLPNFWSYVMALYAVARRRPNGAAGVTALQGRSFDIWTRRPRPIEADGEIVSMTPAHVEIVPHAVRVFVPAST